MLFIITTHFERARIFILQYISILIPISLILEIKDFCIHYSGLFNVSWNRVDPNNNLLCPDKNLKRRIMVSISNYFRHCGFTKFYHNPSFQNENNKGTV